MKHPPRTPAEWLIFYADLADRYRLETTTWAGDGLQRAFVTFLLDAGKSKADLQDLQTDLAMLLPRFSNALIAATHQGAPCVDCARRFATLTATEIVSDMIEVSEQAKTGGLH